MGFDDIFKQKRNGHQNEHGYYSGYGNEHHDNHGGIDQYRYVMEKLKNNKKLLIALSVVVIIIGLIFIAALVMLLPLIMKLLGTIQKNGISGLVEAAKPLLQQLWSGAGK
jgi:type IV secretory pathway component VirB8